MSGLALAPGKPDDVLMRLATLLVVVLGLAACGSESGANAKRSCGASPAPPLTMTKCFGPSLKDAWATEHPGELPPWFSAEHDPKWDEGHPWRAQTTDPAGPNYVDPICPCGAYLLDAGG